MSVEKDGPEFLRLMDRLFGMSMDGRVKTANFHVGGGGRSLSGMPESGPDREDVSREVNSALDQIEAGTATLIEDIDALADDLVEDSGKRK